MAYTTNQLISGAYHASGVVAREFEEVSGQQVTDGLTWLNNILTEKVVDEGMIPYETTYTFSAVAGQEAYVIPDLIDIDTLVFFLDSVRYAMTNVGRNTYFGAPRVENFETLPYSYYMERKLGGATLYLYFKPNEAYSMELHGLFRLSSVALGQDLSLTIDEFYRTYLRYALADRICSEYNFVVPPGVAKQLARYELMIAKGSRTLDLGMRKVSSLQKPSPYNYAFINLGRGILPTV